ncbi:hypothetical protein BDR06DRAFT_681708 [Suillus hirtellus]|nr:hypothetical protein BDR06DRAFT_681708 [Suillus hirtellus]
MNLLIIDHLAVVIILEHSFYVFNKLRYLQHQQKSIPSFYVSLEQYITSPHATAVRKAVSVAVQICEEYSSTSKVKPSFGRFQKRRQTIGDSRKMELIETIVEITLEHRLPRS